MENEKKYKKAFLENFGLSEDELSEDLEYNAIAEWDSVGHMGLMASLEDEFEITMEMDDIVDFSSFKKGKEILSKYEIKIDTAFDEVIEGKVK